LIALGHAGHVVVGALALRDDVVLFPAAGRQAGGAGQRDRRAHDLHEAAPRQRVAEQLVMVRDALLQIGLDGGITDARTVRRRLCLGDELGEAAPVGWLVLGF
jgi:hypothetical protein